MKLPIINKIIDKIKSALNLRVRTIMVNVVLICIALVCFLFLVYSFRSISQGNKDKQSRDVVEVSATPNYSTDGTQTKTSSTPTPDVSSTPSLKSSSRNEVTDVDQVDNAHKTASPKTVHKDLKPKVTVKPTDDRTKTGEQPKVVLFEPQDGKKFDANLEVNGICSNIPDGKRLRVFIYPQKNVSQGKFFDVTINKNNWKSNCYLFGASGDKNIVAVYIADKNNPRNMKLLTSTFVYKN
jgi:hypothetical protein